MAWIDGAEYTWTIDSIEREALSIDGVYGIWDSQKRCLYIGRGNILGRLKSHWYGEHQADWCLWQVKPYSFCFEITVSSEAREVELIRIHRPFCNETIPPTATPG